MISNSGIYKVIHYRKLFVNKNAFIMIIFIKTNQLFKKLIHNLFAKDKNLFTYM